MESMSAFVRMNCEGRGKEICKVSWERESCAESRCPNHSAPPQPGNPHYHQNH